MESFSPQVILVTGCSSGFGLLTAARLAAQGHHVFATMRHLEKKQDLLEEVKKRKATVSLFRLDVNDTGSVHDCIREIMSAQKRIDVVVNNAGFAMGGAFEDLAAEEIRSQMETNFFGVQNVIREILPFMRRQKAGKIINISSISGLLALPGFGAYNASKWALEGFSESLYYELKPFGIQVCLIEPGSYKTKIFYENRRYAHDFFNPASPYHAFSQFLKEKIDRSLKANRRDPEDIARLVEHLVHSKNPPFRNIPDSRSRWLFGLRRLLPFRVFSGLIYRAMMSGYKDINKIS